MTLLCTRFVKLSVERAPFLCERLKIRMLPTIGLVVDGKTKDFIKGLLYEVLWGVMLCLLQVLMSWEAEMISLLICWSGGSAVEESSTILETSLSLHLQEPTKNMCLFIPRKLSEILLLTPPVTRTTSHAHSLSNHIISASLLLVSWRAERTFYFSCLFEWTGHILHADAQTDVKIFFHVGLVKSPTMSQLR